MKREVRDNATKRYPKPVTKVELDDKHVKLRIILIVVFIIIAGVFIGITLSRQFGTKAGWTTIEVTYDENNNSGDFVFQYELGTKNISLTSEKNQLSKIYTESLIKIYQLLDEVNEYQTLKNIYYINKHINEEIEVDSVLYESLKNLNNTRYIYQSLIFNQYSNMFYADSDSNAIKFDAYKNEEMKTYFKSILYYTNNEHHINLELLENNKVKLNVSVEYQTFMKEIEENTFISLEFIKNASIIDYVSDTLIKNNFTTGNISSYDGYTRNLDSRNMEYNMNVRDKEDIVYNAFSYTYKGPTSIVYLRNYKVNAKDESRFYEYKDGTRRTWYIDLNDGLDKAVTSNMICLSNNKTCVAILLEMLNAYVSLTIDTDLINNLKLHDIDTIYINKKEIHHNFDTNIKNIYSTSTISYEVIYDKD